MPIDFIATAAFGLESVVARQVRELGYSEVKIDNGRVEFSADELALCRANLWLRSADRVLVKMGEFPATDFDQLFDQVKALPWPEWLPKDAAFPVNGKSLNSQLSSVPACQAVVKKAIVESLKDHYHLEWFAETGPEYTIEVSLLKDIATITLDTSGVALHKRGYRKLSMPAPLKETLAAALVELSYWNPDRILLDPFCGSGTIPIEAALIGLNIAPGLKREFAAESWPVIGPSVWKTAREEAQDLMRRDRRLAILGSDIDQEVLSLANYHAKQAGVAGNIKFVRLPVAEVTTSHEYGCIICNPPYGERLGEKTEAEEVYRQMGRAFAPLETWSVYVLTSHEGFERFYGRKADRKRKLYNGRIRCDYYQFYGPKPPLVESKS